MAYDVVLGEQTYNGIEAVQMNTTDGGVALFSATSAQVVYPTTVNIVRQKGYVNIGIIYEDNTTGAAVIVLEENGDPSKIVTNNTTCNLTWTGFEE